MGNRQSRDKYPLSPIGATARKTLEVPPFLCCYLVFTLKYCKTMQKYSDK